MKETARKETAQRDILLKIENLNVTYANDEETVCAVNGLNLELGRKETLGLVGETGAGKTTTALSIMGLLPKRVGKCTAGTVLFNGEDLLKTGERDMQHIRGEKISMIFQDPMTSLNPVLTVGEQVREALELHNYSHKSMEELEARVDGMFELVGIPKARKSEYPHQFSGGMKQRVVIAMALACSPELLIADEPTTALDVTIQAQVLNMMTELKEELGTSMIMITHDLGIVAETCDYVNVVYAGAVVESGTVEDIFEAGRHHPYTVGLFLSLPSLEEEQKRLTPIQGLMPDPTNLPSGCPFHPRCSRCTEQCRTKRPEAARFGTQTIWCHLYGGKEPK